MSRILLLSQRTEDLAFAKALSSSMGLPCFAAQDVQELAQDLDVSGPAFLLLDGSNPVVYKAIEATLLQRLGALTASVNPNWTTFITSGTLAENLHLLRSPFLGNLVLRQSGPLLVEFANFYGVYLKRATNQSMVGIQEYFGTDAQIQAVALSHSNQKQAAAEAARKYAVAAGFKSRLATLVASSVDEVLMNAIYDAPVDALGRQLHAQLNRTAPIELRGQAEIQMELVYDRKSLGITVTDRWGSLKNQSMFEKFAKEAEHKDYEGNQATTSAGIGLATIFEKGANLVFVCEQGQRTQVQMFFPKTQSFKEYKNHVRFVLTQQIF